MSLIDTEKVKKENGFMGSCELHLSHMIDDLKKVDAFASWCCLCGGGDEVGEDYLCDYPKCKNIAHFDVFWGDWAFLNKELKFSKSKFTGVK